MSEDSEDHPLDPIRAWIGHSPGPLERCWPTEPGASAFDAFYTAVLRHTRVHPAEALAAIDRLDAESRRRLDRVDALRWHRLRGHACMGLGRTGESCGEYRTAWRGFRALGLDREVATTGIGYAAALGHAGRIVEALDVVREANARIDRRDRRRRARLLSNEGTLLFLTGHYREATRCYRRAARLLAEEGLPFDAALARYNIGHTQLYRGDTKAARAALDQVLPVFREAQRKLQEIYVEFSYTLADVLDGNWEGILLRLRDLEDRVADLGDIRAAANMGQESAEILLRLGALGPAEKAAGRSLATYRRLELRRNVAHVGFLHGRILARLGRHREASIRFEESRDALHELGDAWARRRVELELAGVRTRLGRPDEALEMLRHTRSSARGRAEKVLTFRASQLLAEAYLAAGSAARALPIARQAHRAAAALLLRPERPGLALTCAEAAAATDRLDLARAWMDRALDEQHVLTTRTSGEVAVTGETEGQRDFRERLHRLALAVHGGQHADRVLALVLRALPRVAGEIAPTVRRVRGTALATSMTALRDELLGITDGRAHAVRYRQLEARLEEALRAGGTQQQTSDQRSQGRVDGVAVPHLGDRQLVVLLSDDARRVDSAWHALVLDTQGRARYVPLPAAGSVLRSHWIGFRLVLEQAAHLPAPARARLLEQTRAEGARALDQLRQAFWDPLELDPGRVVVVPDAHAHGLPLESLAATDSRHAADQFLVSRVPHPDFLSLPRTSRRARSTGRALVLHDGGPGTRAEASAVQRLLRRQGMQAQLDSRRRALENPSHRIGVLHVAAHGVYHREQWLLNGIKLRDGWMGIETLPPSRLRDALLFFSSCESGLQHNAPGGQMGGWTEAGLRAGAREILLALWKIPDEYAESFANVFYRHWTEGVRADHAACLARVAVREELDHPFAWASFLTVGRD